MLHLIQLKSDPNFLAVPLKSCQSISYQSHCFGYMYELAGSDNSLYIGGKRATPLQAPTGHACNESHLEISPDSRPRRI